MTPDASPALDASGGRWTARHSAALAIGLLAAVAVRIPLLPLPGLAGDLDEFTGWVHRIATSSLTGLYGPGDVTFPPVMAYVWGILAAVAPVFGTATDSHDATAAVVMKLPPTIADLLLAVGVAWALRSRPGWAVVAALGIALHPAVIDVSALFGQYEPIYTLLGLLAFLLAVGGHRSLAAVALGLALMAKPQAAVFVVPLAAWAIGRFGLRETARLVAIALVTVVVTWLPFVPANGPADYLRSLATHQNDLFGVLSLRAWNPWWILQSSAGDSFLSDANPLLGPLTPRHLGILVAALLESYVFALVLRRPTRDGLAWGLAASSLVAFVALTTMHERYAYPALVFLAVLFPDRRAVALWLVFGVAHLANLLAAIPPTPEIGAALPVGGIVGIAGSVVITAVAAFTIVALRGRREDLRGSEPQQVRPLASTS